MAIIRPGREADLMGVLRLAENTEFAPLWSAAEYGRIVVPQGASGPMRCLFVACEGAMLAGFAVGLVVGDEQQSSWRVSR